MKKRRIPFAVAGTMVLVSTALLFGGKPPADERKLCSEPTHVPSFLECKKLGTTSVQFTRSGRRSERRGLLKKDLTEPTLLEMSANGYQACEE
jgi:hypothetical protein